MRRHGLWMGWLAACSTAPLDGAANSFDTFETVTVSASGDPSSGDDPSTTGADPGTGDTTDPTVEPGSSGAASDSGPADESTGSTGGEPGTSEGSTGTPVSESSSDGAPMEESGPMETGPDPLACSDGDLGSTVGNGVASGSIAGALDDITISCASNGGVDHVYLWTAPAADSYTFDLSGSNYDTALALFDPDCAGAEIACDDDAISPQSLLTRDLAAGQQVLVVVDGYNGATGNYVLDINAGPPVDFSCAEGGDLGSATGNVAVGSTVGATDNWSATCQASDGPDVAYGWTAPAAGSYTFSLVGSSYDTILTLQSPDCTGTQLACSDDAVGLQSELTQNLAAGETVLIVIDGYNTQTGNYTLSID